MVLGNYSVFYAKNVKTFKFGTSGLSTTQMGSTGASLQGSYYVNNTTSVIDLVGDPDTSNPTASYAFAKDFNISGNETATSEENLLGDDLATGSQNQEISIDPNSLMTCESTLVYRNVLPATIFQPSVKSCMIELDNGESSTTGKLTFLFNNIKVTHVGSITRNAEGIMEQKVKFVLRGGNGTGSISVTSGATTWVRARMGPDWAEEIRTA